MGKSLQLQEIPKEVRLMLDIIKEESISSQTISINIDWDIFLSYAIHHRLFPRIYLKIKDIESSKIPLTVIEKLSFLYKRNTLQMLKLSGEMGLIHKLLDEKDIKTLFLKGPVVAQDLYGDISLRTSSDLDFLIPIDHLDEAENILLEQGYEKDDYIETVLNDWRFRHHHVTYFHPHKQIKLEIHWRLHPGPGKETSFCDLWNRKRESKAMGSLVYYLGKEDLFHYLIVHGARHGWSRLRWLDDIQQIIKQPLDWDLIYKLCKSNHHLHIAGQALILANQLLDVKITDDMKRFVNSQRAHKLAQEAIFYLERVVNLHTLPLPDEVAEYHQRHSISLMSSHQKVLYLCSLLYPFPEDAEVLPLPKQIHFLYFPLRPFLWAWRKIKKPVWS